MEATSSTINVAQYNTKIKMLFEKFLEPEFQLKNDVYLNRLLTHLSGKEKEEMENTFINLPIFSDWLVQAVSIWESKGIIPATNIGSFTLNLAALISKNETKFCKLNNNNFYIKLVNIVQARQSDAAPTIKLGYIKLLMSFLEHNSGIEWMIACNFWEDVLNFTLTNQTIYITREGRIFMSKLLEVTIDRNENFCNNIVKRIMMPLGENTLNTIKAAENMVSISDETVHQNLSPTLQLIGNILEHFLESLLFPQRDFRIVLIFLKNFHLEQRICNFMMIAQNKYLVFDLGKIMFIMQFLELYLNVVTNSLKMADVKSSVRKIMSIFSTNISKGNFENVMKFCHFGQFYWNVIGYKIPCKSVNKENEPISFANQLIVLQMLPVFCVAFKYCLDENVTICEMNTDDFRDEYLNKLFKIMCENTIRIAYNWRNFLLSQSSLFEIGSKAIMYIMKSRKYYPRERAATIFQCFIYTLRDITTAVKEKPDKIDYFSREKRFLSLLLDGTTTFIEEFNITWRDSVETICVMGVSFDLLCVPTWPAELVVKGLKLVNISIAKYMSPNLTLLIDRTNDSTMALIGPLLYAKMHDSMWEVRDSALEVVCTIAHISTTKFPSLQKILIEAELPDLVLKMATNDGESFVRATAIKCLQEMIKVDDIWNNYLKEQDLPKMMRQILYSETEGIVRVEAASFMCVVYENHQFSNDTLEEIYDAMIHAATGDLHWEVKVRALKFWECVINNHLQHQGMIDGRFPDVTFSKECRKIVALTRSELKKRLQKVLNQLSTIGCLGVLMSAVQDDCDIEVSKNAVKITQKFVDLIKTHNITQGDLSTPSSPIIENAPSSVASSGISSSGNPMDDFQNSPCSYNNPCQSPINSDEIIDQILNSRDICLLQNVYSPSDYGSVHNYEIQVKKIVTPNEFLMFTKKDLDQLINEKRSWLTGIEDLGSLLDDMLKAYQDEDINGMDCY